jgi:hypothetical protein
MIQSLWFHGYNRIIILDHYRIMEWIISWIFMDDFDAVKVGINYIQESKLYYIWLVVYLPL